MEKKVSLGLLPKLIVAIVLGVIVGMTLGELVDGTLIRITNTIKGLFENFLNFVIPLILIGFLVPGIAFVGTGAGRVFAITVGIAYGATVFAGAFAYFMDSVFFPFLLNGSELSVIEIGKSAEALFEIKMSPIMEVMSALILACILGFGIAATGNQVLKEAFEGLQAIVTKLIENVILPFIPAYIFCLFANMAYEGTVFVILKVFAKVSVLILVLHWLVICIQYIIAGSVAKKNPFICMKNILPAYLTALGIQSSIATIPITLTEVKKNRVRENITELTVPLCSMVHLSGSAISVISCTLAIMMVKPEIFEEYGFTVMFPFILMIGIMMIAAPKVPGGTILIISGLLTNMLGFTETETSLMMVLYMIQDSFGTACNVMGDGAITMLADAFISGKKKGNG